MRDKLLISSTSALVLLWCNSSCYSSEFSKEFLARLNLDAGLSLFNKCNEIWPHYHEVIRNRKFAVMNLMEKSKRENDELNQVVILGAGLSPLSIEWKTQHPDMTVFDIDIDNMNLKKKLVSQIESKELQEIKFITADFENLGEVEDSLMKNGFDLAKPSLVVIEGISYYLSRAALFGLIGLFKKLETGSRLVMDYLVPTKNIAVDRQYIPEQVFNLIKEECHLPEIHKYDNRDFENISNARISIAWTMMEIEKKRKGENIFFPSSDSGWIEICLLSK